MKISVMRVTAGRPSPQLPGNLTDKTLRHENCQQAISRKEESDWRKKTSVEVINRGGRLYSPRPDQVRQVSVISAEPGSGCYCREVQFILILEKFFDRKRHHCEDQVAMQSNVDSSCRLECKTFVPKTNPDPGS